MYSKFNGANSNAFLSVWEAFSFTIQATRVQETSAPIIKNPPGNPSSFEGRLREVSLIFRRSMNNNLPENYIIIGGNPSPTLNRKKDGTLKLKSHWASYSQQSASFWAKEFSQRENKSCIGGSKFYPGCFNSSDESDTSFLNVFFPVGHASFPHGKYADGLITVYHTTFDSSWVPKLEIDSPHQNFVLLLLRIPDY